MRTVGFTLVAVLLATVVVQAQPPAGTPGVPPVGPAPGKPPAAAPAPAADPKLDTHLLGWQKKMGEVNNFSARFELKRTEALFKKDRTYHGQVLCMKPNFARLRIDNAADKTDYEAYICNGKAIYEYRGKDKTITEFKLNPNPGAAGGDNLMLDFLGGMPAAVIKQRFQISLFKEDANYFYLDIKPTLGKDQQEFQQVRFALFGPGAPAQLQYLPAQVWVMKPNGDTEMWVFADQKTNVEGVSAKTFEMVPIKDWTFKTAPTGPAPAPAAPTSRGAVPAGFAPQPVLPGGTGLPAGPGAVKPK